MSDLSGKTTIVVGASRGLGRGIAEAFAEAGAPVVAVARTATALAELANGSGTIQPEVADAGDATAAGIRLDRYEPEVVLTFEVSMDRNAQTAEDVELEAVSQL